MGDNPPLTRDEHLQVLEEYHYLLKPIGERPGMTLEELRGLAPKIPFIAGRMRPDHLDILLQKINTIHHWFNYFGVDIDLI